jgi:hypothetical protein
MKNLIKATSVLLLFSISVIFFQESCLKKLDAQTVTPSSQKGKMVYSKTLTLIFAHLSQIKVKEGKAVQPCQVIGISGNS